MATLEGLSPAQCRALQGVAVGDLVFMVKMEMSRYDDEDDSEDQDEEDNEDYEDGDEDDGVENADAGEGENETEDEAQEDASDDQAEAGTDSDDDDNDWSGVEQSMTTDATETLTPIPPRMFVISDLTKDTEGNITDVKLSLLTYSDKVNTAEAHHAYHVYGRECVHHHLTTCGRGQVCTAAVSIQEIATDESIRFMVKPIGDYVRQLNTSIFGHDQGLPPCVEGCNQGFLDRAEMLQGMIKDYDPPTLVWATATGEQLPPNMQAVVCPVCIGADLLRDQQELQAMLLQGGFIDLGLVADFHARLNPRRREVGYRFRQFDEREWGYCFDDMLSDEDRDYDNEDAGDDGRWQSWAEIEDPNSGAQKRPASALTIASLTRKMFEDVELDVADCQICTTEFKPDSKIIELPCGHACFDESCLETWLEQYDTCPICRATVPAVAPNTDSTDPVAAATCGRGSTADEVKDATAASHQTDGEDMVVCEW